MYKLRDYQENQIKFLESHSDSENLFNGIISLESPTGSGKSITMLQHIKNYFSKNEGKRVFISTGFNELVWQIYDFALSMGINTKILVGKSNATCSIKNGNIEYKVFDNTAPLSVKCDTSRCSTCSFRRSNGCRYNAYLDYIENTTENLLVVTNHLTMFYKHELFNKMNGGFIDECQALGDFYRA